jgi:hypothetical protein
MRRIDAGYYESRAARERALAEKAPDWYVQRYIQTAEYYERLAAKRRERSAAPQPQPPGSETAESMRGR